MKKVLAILFFAGCSLAPVDYSGKSCDQACPAHYSCVAGVCRRGDDGGTLPGGDDAGSLPGGDGGLQVLVATVSADTDDGMWEGTDELLHSRSDTTVEVGAGTTVVAGFRFVLAVPRGATLVDVRLELARQTGDAPETQPLIVQAWNSIAVPPFDATHVHPPELHDAAGFVGAVGTLLPAWHPSSSSSDLSPLLQDLVNRADWVPGATVGFTLSESSTVTTWAGFDDLSRAGATGARLVVQYRY